MAQLNWAKRLDPYIWMDEINSKNVEDAVKAVNALRILKDKEAIYSLIDSIENRMKDTREAYLNILTELRITRKLAVLKDELRKKVKEVQFDRKILDSIRKYFREQKTKETKDLEPDKLKAIENKMNTVTKYIREMNTNFNNALREVYPIKELEKMKIAAGREKGALESFLKDIEGLDKLPDRDKIIEDMKTFYDKESKFMDLSRAIFEILARLGEGVPIIPYVKKLKSIQDDLGNKFADVLSGLGSQEFLDRVAKARKNADEYKKLMMELLDEIKEAKGKAISVQYQSAIQKNIDNARVLISIIEALRAICTENEATQTLLDLLDSLNIDVQRKFLDIIEEQKDSLEIQFGNLKRKYELIIGEIFRALGDFKDNSIINKIIELLNTNNVDIKRKAIKLLADIGDSKTIKDLARFLDDEDLLVQEYAIIALKRMVPFLKGMKKEEILNYINLGVTKK
ncbi:MAG: HEAT repeat domain-containing protein [Candidatus Helarchaeota archaeon]